MDAIYEETEVKVIEEVESCYTLVDLPSSKKKKRSKGSGEHADKPKKPRSAYLLYYFDVHQSLQHEHPDMPQSEINKRISDSWKRLNVADKGYYLERAKMEKEGVDPMTQSAASSPDVPGFRKILPRTNYILLPKGSVGEERQGGSVELCMEGGVDALGEETPQTSAQEPLVSPLTLGSEVELVEQCIAIEALSEDKAASLGKSAALHGILSQYSTSSAGRSLALAQDGRHGTTLLMKEDEGRAVGEDYGGVGMAVEEGLEGGAVMPQVKVDTAHLVAIIPNHELVENKVFPAASPIMMLPMINRAKPDSKPSFKLSIKYTRRGRGSCSTPGCSFTYVTRHKPPQCPECGQHLGGKWVPPAAKGAEPGSTPSSRKQQKVQGDGSSSIALSTEVAPQGTVRLCNVPTRQREAQENNTTKAIVATKAQDNSSSGSGEPGASTAKGGRRKREKTGAVAAYQPADGTLIKLSDGFQGAESTGVIGLSGGRVRVISKDKSSSSGQKRRIRAILPAPSTSSVPSQPAVVQWIAVQPSKIRSDTKINSRAVKPPNERILGLKPNTLKQLGHTVAPSALDQKPTTINSNQCIVTDNGVKILSMVPFKQNSGTSLALGLSTARGRGRCKNPSCDYIYKNRHKPQYCPSCGCELTTKTPKKSKVPLSPELTSRSTGLLESSQPLTLAQRELQRQSTVALLKHTLQYPENEAELQDIFGLIHSLNHAQGEGDGEREQDLAFLQNGWPSFYEPAATHCSMCSYPLYRGEEGCSVAGQQQCWLLTESVLQPVSLQLKVCPKLQCLAIHSFTDLHPGLFNVGNQLLVSLDLFFKIRAQIKLVQDPALAAMDILHSTHTPPGCVLGPEVQTHLQELLCSGYWAFECLTVRDYNDMICGVCGIAPKLEITQRNTNNVLQLKNVEFTWPEFQTSEEVQVEEFWLAMESEALEQAAFPSSVSITRFDASIIAPFFPPLMRSSVVINTEKDKITTSPPHAGDPSVLVRLVHDGQLRPDEMDQHTEEELRYILEQCGTPSAPDSSKDELLVSLCLLYTQVQNGLSTAPQPPQHLTAGKLSKVCPHQVVCGSKYLVRGETARDHVDLLVSSRFWPPVYVTDCAQKVALCADVLYPELASQMWGRNQGCFSDPTAAAEYVSCAELQDQQYSVDLSSVDSNPRLHPVTKSLSRWIVRPDDSADSSPPAILSTPDPHHAITLCKELQPYASLVSTLTSSSGEDKGRSSDGSGCKALVFDNPAHYYLYNRLVDFMSSRDIVSQQIAEVLKVCQQGEVVMIRDALYRLGVAQLNTEEEQGDEEGERDMDAVAVEDMVLE
ncbi:HMG domain-containing protein 3 [Salminus brasiliensis]|uniref:HMG domain-containing protein 3 n=1 Tax=Salminus brasiliensis TaxID=930266 RepID=UPI003B8367F2